MFIAHRREDDGCEQSIFDHLSGTAHLAKRFAQAFGAAQLAETIGLAHDIGKFSPEFQRRIRNADIRVDHATAGARVVTAGSKNFANLIAAYCIMGHHGGLPDGGSKGQPDIGTMYYRLQKGDLPDFSAYQNEVQLSDAVPPEGWRPEKDVGFSLAFLTRMLFSVLVDADWLDTEDFMQNGAIKRGNFEGMEALHEKLINFLDAFKTPERVIDKKRSELLQHCLNAAATPKGLFSLTAPTGSGKTISSLAFALQHAVKQGLQRVIYVIPYNSIIEQNAKIFEDILGEENVVQHHSNMDYHDGDSHVADSRRFATENWDAPLIVTSNVQFFESLYANKSSACRKLHNIANSVIIFDEAQMIPLPYLLPCVAAIRELVVNCGCSAVLATATQSSLDEYFNPLPIREINESHKEMCDFFRRTTFVTECEPLADDALASRLSAQKQVLCVVNTRKKAQELAGKMNGALHLSTTMYPAHRSSVMREIRRRLKSGEVCQVISTSLIEAGVDVDFPVLYREKAGLDSVIQAAGRCNREGKQRTEDALVYIFTFADGRPPRSIKQNIAAYEHVARAHGDIASPEAIRCYFEQLRYIIGREGLDKNNAVQQMNDAMKRALSFPFRSIAKDFHLIDNAQQTLVIECEEAEGLCRRLRNGERTRQLMRKLQQYSISLYVADIEKLRSLGQLEQVDDELYLLPEMYYDEKYGVTLNPDGGNAIIL